MIAQRTSVLRPGLENKIFETRALRIAQFLLFPKRQP